MMTWYDLYDALKATFEMGVPESCTGDVLCTPGSAKKGNLPEVCKVLFENEQDYDEIVEWLDKSLTKRLGYTYQLYRTIGRIQWEKKYISFKLASKRHEFNPNLGKSDDWIIYGHYVRLLFDGENNLRLRIYHDDGTYTDTKTGAVRRCN